MGLPETMESSKDALLQLERSAADSPAQLKEAARILGVDLTQCAGSFQLDDERFAPRLESSPREEWVFRWLLKRLAVRAYRVHPDSFVLFQYLVRQLSPTVVDTLSKKAKFHEIFGTIVDDFMADIPLAVKKTGETSDSDSSHTVTGSSPVQAREGKKRKRTGGSEPLTEEPPLHSSVVAYLKLLDLLHDLVFGREVLNAQEKPAGSALCNMVRFPYAFIGPIVGKLLHLSSRLLAEFMSTKRRLNTYRLLRGTTAIFGLWDLKTSVIRQGPRYGSNDVFSQNCFLPAVRLHRLVRCNDIQNPNTEFILHNIEKLVALHVAIPARSNFRERGGAGIDYSQADNPDWSAVQPVTDEFRPLFEEKFVDTVDFEELPSQRLLRADKDGWIPGPAWSPAALVPTFYNMIIRSLNTKTFRRQSTEASWLETVFVSLAELAYSFLKNANPGAETTEFGSILEQMFSIVQVDKVKLSLHTILTHAAHSNLLKNDPMIVRWGLTALLINLGVDVFLPNSGFTDSRRLLDALLEHIFERESGENDKFLYRLIRDEILIPLLRGFAAARDLSTFVQTWLFYLGEVESSRKSRQLEPANIKLSVWEDDDVIAEYRKVLKNSYTDSQVQTLVQTAMEKMGISESGDSKPVVISSDDESYANLVVLEATTGTWVQGGPLQVDSLSRILNSVYKTITEGEKANWQWRLWRLAKNIIVSVANRPDEVDTPVQKTAGDLLELAVRQIGQKTSQPTTLRANVAAADLVLSVTKCRSDAWPTPPVSDFLTRINEFLKSLAPRKGDKTSGSWDGRLETLEHPSAQGVAYVLTLLKTPEVWTAADVSNDIRDDFISQLLLLAASTEPGEDNNSLLTFPKLWDILLSREYLPLVPSLRRRALPVLRGRLQDSPALRSIILSSLMRFPIGVIGYSHSAAEIVRTLENILLNEDLTQDTLVTILSLIAKWTRDPDARLWVSDWKVPISVAQRIRLTGDGSDLEAIRSFRSLLRPIVNRLCADGDPSRRAGKLQDLHNNLSSVVKLKSIDHLSLAPVLARGYLALLWEHRDVIGEKEREIKLSRQRSKLFKLVLADLKSSRELLEKGDATAQKTVHAVKTVEALEDFDDLISQNPETTEILEVIVRRLEEAGVESGRHARRLLRRRKLRESESVADMTRNHVFSEDSPLQFMQSEEQHQFVHEAVNRFRAMTDEERIRVLKDIRAIGFDGPGSSYRLILVGLVVSSLSPGLQLDDDTAGELSKLISALLRVMVENPTADRFSMAAECVDVIFRSHARGVAQWNVDDILASIPQIIDRYVGSTDAQMISEFTDTVYVRLCRLLGAIIGLYRQRIGGRYHVLVPSLQSLLRAFFPVKAGTKRDADGNSLASLRRPERPLHSRMTTEHAVHFTRLLTSLCDPTLSAVTRPTTGRDALVDVTKANKQIAGQHMRPLIAFYIRQMLAAPLPSELREAFAPGLYAVLDTMSNDTKRGLNDSLDRSGQALFKTLHEDYVKFGKWNNQG